MEKIKFKWFTIKEIFDNNNIDGNLINYLYE